eukprot:COSAG06_NODE_1489_length_9283_cov_4.259037_1_plen_186_part_10
MGPDAAGGSWSRDLRPLPAGKKTLSRYGNAASPKKLLLEKHRQRRISAAKKSASAEEEPAESYTETLSKYLSPQRRKRSDGSPTRLHSGSASPNRMAQLPTLDTPPRRVRLSRESLTSTLTVVPSVAVESVAVEAVAETPAEVEAQVEEEDVSERVGEELYKFLGEAKLTQYVPTLRDLLGAQTVA